MIINRQKYDGAAMKQVSGIVDVFDIFFNNEKFDTILEIGTGNGVFTTFIAKRTYKSRKKFLTYDIKKPNKNRLNVLDELGVKFYHEDINNVKNIDLVGRTLILNDGGLKIPQFFRFSKVIKSKDIILTHDYYKDVVPASGIITLPEVENCIKENDLFLKYELLFDEFLWLCVEKR